MESRKRAKKRQYYGKKDKGVPTMATVRRYVSESSRISIMDRLTQFQSSNEPGEFSHHPRISELN